MSDAIPPMSGHPSQPKTSPLAISSLILGILGVVCFSILTAIPAVICGHMALSRIKRSAGTLGGQGLAIGGLVTGYLGIALAILVIPMMLAIAIPNFVKARDTALANACSNNLREIESAKQQWAAANNKEVTAIPTGTDLVPNLKSGHLPRCAAGGTYKINAVGESPTCSIPTHKLK